MSTMPKAAMRSTWILQASQLFAEDIGIQFSVSEADPRLTRECGKHIE
jgi:hypothetical protein